MHDGRPQRKLAAILAADVAGYSRLIRADEDGTLASLRSLRAEVVEPRIARNGGRIVKLMGDGILVDFASAVDAVHAAVDIQEALARRNIGLPADRRVDFRVGINLGDVVIDGDDIHGDGVNMAARLEALSGPGGICISNNVHEQIRDRTAFAFEDTGEHIVKAHDRPVRAWQWVARGKSALRDIDQRPMLPDKWSIAVLPFDNMTNDPEQQFFADGLVEDVITALSRVDRLFVTARTSSFAYRGCNVGVREIGRDLGVHYVVEGSVRTAGRRVRVTAQLIDATTGKHVWAERYDREAEDIFDIQDEITRAIVASTETQVHVYEARGHPLAKRASVSAWALANRAFFLASYSTPEAFEEAESLAGEALKLDPSSSSAHTALAIVLFHKVWMGFAPDDGTFIDRARDAAQSALRLDPTDEYAHWIMGLILMKSREFDKSIAEFERAIEINPNCSLAYGSLATAQNFNGQPDAAVANNEIAIRSDPRSPALHFRYGGLALSHWLTGRFQTGAEMARKAINCNPAWPQAHIFLTACLSDLDRIDEARGAWADLRARHPDAKVVGIANLPFRDPETARLLQSALDRAVAE